MNQDPNLQRQEFWQTPCRGTNQNEYKIYLACADDGKGMDITTDSKEPLKSYDEWVAS